MMYREMIVIVEDEVDMAENCRRVLSKQGYDCAMYTDSTKAWEQIQRTPPDLVLTDLRMPQLDGMALLERIKQTFPQVVVVMITAYATVESAVEAMKRGADDYIAKPFTNDELSLRVRRILDNRQIMQENRYLREEIRRVTGFGEIIGRSTTMRAVLDTVGRIAPTDCKVLITGESGTGKELVARAIHAHSLRGEREFVAINCASLTESLLDSELFGHEKGAFTGAVKEKPGLFEIAHRGTLFLDEIGDISLPLQAKLLRVLQEGEFRRVGGVRLLRTDVRVLASTNKNIEKIIESGEFREDLYYRLRTVHIHLPPLRERKEDIPLLINHFLVKYSRRIGHPLRPISPDALQLLIGHDWPGNIRELENAIEGAVTLATGEVLTPEDVPFVGHRHHVDRPLSTSDFPTSLSEIERQYILQTLAACGGNRTLAARYLGIGRRTLYEKLKRFGIE